MKKVKIILPALLLSMFMANSASAQVSESKKQDVKVVEQAPTYIMDVKKLMTCFKGGEVPESFPKYDATKTKDENKQIVSEWCNVSTNYAKLSDVGIEKLKTYRSKSAGR